MQRNFGIPLKWRLAGSWSLRTCLHRLSWDQGSVVQTKLWGKGADLTDVLVSQKIPSRKIGLLGLGDQASSKVVAATSGPRGGRPQPIYSRLRGAQPPFPRVFRHPAENGTPPASPNDFDMSLRRGMPPRPPPAWASRHETFDWMTCGGRPSPASRQIRRPNKTNFWPQRKISTACEDSRMPFFGTLEGISETSFTSAQSP
jgi:hypothetical protein